MGPKTRLSLLPVDLRCSEGQTLMPVAIKLCGDYDMVWVFTLFKVSNIPSGDTHLQSKPSFTTSPFIDCAEHRYKFWFCKEI